MQETRRNFLLFVAGATAYFASYPVPAWAQRRRKFPEPPQASATRNPAEVGKLDTTGVSAKKAALVQNEREFRSGVERLYQLSSELRDEVQKTSTSEVLSVRMYKKTEEIEKLAKQLKVKVKV
jgi:hypothetical protein